jgi:hypothetical protein
MKDAVRQEPVSSNDRRIWAIAIALFVGLVCCMAVGYIAYLGSIVLIVQQSSADATATTASEGQNAPSTADPDATQVTKFDLIDKFDSNQNGWKVGKEDSEFWVGEMNVESGAYTWRVHEFFKTFLDYSNFSKTPVLEDFDISVHAKIVGGDSGSCSGIIFRESPRGWAYGGGYIMSVCKDGQFIVSYLDEEGKWPTSSGWITSPAIRDDWNRIVINARGSRFTCKINDFVVYEMNDTHSTRGRFALFIEIHGDDQNSPQTNLSPAGKNISFVPQGDDTIFVTFLFDNFSLWSR